MRRARHSPALPFAPCRSSAPAWTASPARRAGSRAFPARRGRRHRIFPTSPAWSARRMSSLGCSARRHRSPSLRLLQPGHRCHRPDPQPELLRRLLQRQRDRRQWRADGQCEERRGDVPRPHAARAPLHGEPGALVRGLRHGKTQGRTRDGEARWRFREGDQVGWLSRVRHARGRLPRPLRARQAAASFEVRELGGGKSSVAFSYRIAGRRGTSRVIGASPGSTRACPCLRRQRARPANASRPRRRCAHSSPASSGRRASARPRARGSARRKSQDRTVRNAGRRARTGAGRSNSPGA